MTLVTVVICMFQKHPCSFDVDAHARCCNALSSSDRSDARAAAHSDDECPSAIAALRCCSGPRDAFFSRVWLAERQSGANLPGQLQRSLKKRPLGA
jgi:hypothetical protein